MPAPYAIFCANPLDPRSAEPDFSLEFVAAREAGFSPILIDHDELDQRISPGAALRKPRIDEPGVGVYRGWMLRSEAYAGLFNALLERDVRLLTSPEEYAASHHAPGSYALLKNWMASMTWVPLPAIDDPAKIRAFLAQFGSSAVILKDFVPSSFASADFGVDQSGRWWLLEVGDGRVSGLPEPEAASPVFAALADRVRSFGELH